MDDKWTPNLSAANKRDGTQVFCRFLLVFFLLNACLSWLPQFLGAKFKPSDPSWALPSLGMDLFAVQFSAQRFGHGLSSHFIDAATDGKTYPYSMRGITQAYGNLATLAMFPFRNVDWWLGITISMLVFVWKKVMEPLGLPKSRILWLPATLAIIALSGPVAMLLERGQLEILVPFLLYFFWREFRVGKVTWVGAFALGLTIHIKVWPVLLLLLLLHRRSWKAFLMAAGTPVALTLATAPWFPLLEYVRSVRGIGDVTSEMRGWAGVSLFSLLSVVNFSFNWHMVTAIWLLLTGSLIFAADRCLTKMPGDVVPRSLLFALTLVCSALAPGYLCDYCMIAGVYLLPAALEMDSGWITEVTAAVVLSSLVVFNYYAGIIKAAALLTFVLFSFVTIFRRATRSKSSQRPDS